MRDPKRIDSILNTIRLIWTDCPDLRLGQLIISAIGLKADLFDIEDDILHRKLIEFGLEFVKDETEDKILVQSGYLAELLREAKDEKGGSFEDNFADWEKEED